MGDDIKQTSGIKPLVITFVSLPQGFKADFIVAHRNQGQYNFIESLSNLCLVGGKKGFYFTYFLI